MGHVSLRAKTGDALKGLTSEVQRLRHPASAWKRDQNGRTGGVRASDRMASCTRACSYTHHDGERVRSSL
jgi:hypothetical protein